MRHLSSAVHIMRTLSFVYDWVRFRVYQLTSDIHDIVEKICIAPSTQVSLTYRAEWSRATHQKTIYSFHLSSHFLTWRNQKTSS